MAGVTPEARFHLASTQIGKAVAQQTGSAGSWLGLAMITGAVVEADHFTQRITCVVKTQDPATDGGRRHTRRPHPGDAQVVVELPALGRHVYHGGRDTLPVE